jgi:hypothetical protein
LGVRRAERYVETLRRGSWGWFVEMFVRMIGIGVEVLWVGEGGLAGTEMEKGARWILKDFAGGGLEERGEG